MTGQLMKRTEVEHVIKSAGLIAKDKKDIALSNLNICRQRGNSENKMVDPVGLEPTTRRL